MYERFEKLLKEHGITAYRVAKDTGVTTATLTSWKQGKYTPKRDKLQKIADYFGVPVDYFSSSEPMLEIIKQSTIEAMDNISTHTEYSIDSDEDKCISLSSKVQPRTFKQKNESIKIPTINSKAFSKADKVFVEILEEILEEKQKAEFNRKVQERLPEFPTKQMNLAAHFDGDELTEEELKEVQQFAEFVKNRRKSQL